MIGRRRGVELKTADQMRQMRRAGLVVAQAHAELAEAAAPGVTTGELDQLAREVLARNGASSSFLGYGAGFGLPPYPAVACISVNEEIVHGIPGERVLADGDLVSFDFGAIIGGWHGDGAVTFPAGEWTPERRRLSDVTRDALWAGIGAARLGGRVSDISHAVEEFIESCDDHEFGIVEEYTGHGIGSAMHQPPDVPNYGRPGRGPKIVEGLCLAVEPMITWGSAETATLDDEWTVVTRDSSDAAHWEHTITVTKRGLWVLTALDGGEEALGRLGLPFGPLAD
ncbi:type I methionyl aminopeptidase [Nigerium massiliense]|uniref:type I methionyl aminopeptidase n=1 Tax=Nigerium massiliense TaxID=1522317 RepID=UPI00058F1E15|nr:type I methionyl aminopeptidase [Nigerium massiliense]